MSDSKNCNNFCKLCYFSQEKYRKITKRFTEFSKNLDYIIGDEGIWLLT